MRLSAEAENRKLIAWANMDDAEFFFKYLVNSTEDEFLDFIRLFPDFLSNFRIVGDSERGES